MRVLSWISVGYLCRRRLASFTLAFLALGASGVSAQMDERLLAADGRLAPYVIPGQLDLPMPKWSVLKQPWRAYAETVAAEAYLAGLGINWGKMPPNKDADSVAGILRGAGFSRIRYELPWRAINWDENGLNPDSQLELAKVMKALRAHSLRPLILLNGHHLRPCPIQKVRTLVLISAANEGATTLDVAGDVSDLPAWRTQVLSLTTSRQAGPLVTAANKAGHLNLSRPLLAPLSAGTKITTGVLKYLPFYPVGTPQFTETLGGWKKYVALAVSAVAAAYGSDDFDVEVWNELTFGSNFLNVNNYAMPYVVAEIKKDSMGRGGVAWALAEATVETLKKTSLRGNVIWGFSNTTFFHTAIKDLPPGISGQSYHPYNGSKRCSSQQLESKENNAEPFFPDFCSTIPESVFATFQKTETLFRLINPIARTEKPVNSRTFVHYITEHGERAADFGLASPEAQKMKAKFQLRAPTFWLNKGISAFYTYHVYDNNDDELGLMPANENQEPIALSAFQRMTQKFLDAVPIKSLRQLEFEFASVKISPAAIKGQAGQPILSDQDLVQILPYQINDHRFVIPMYVMALNFPDDLPPETYDISIKGIKGQNAQVNLYDPLLNRVESVAVRSRSGDSIELRLNLTDSVRLLEIAD